MSKFVSVFLLIVGALFVANFAYRSLFHEIGIGWEDVKDLLLGCAFIIVGLDSRKSPK